MFQVSKSAALALYNGTVQSTVSLCNTQHSLHQCSEISPPAPVGGAGSLPAGVVSILWGPATPPLSGSFFGSVFIASVPVAVSLVSTSGLGSLISGSVATTFGRICFSSHQNSNMN